MKNMKKYTWDLDHAELYFGVIKVLKIPVDRDYLKIKGILAYRRGLYKDFILQGPTWFKIKISAYKHWKLIEEEN